MTHIRRITAGRLNDGNVRERRGGAPVGSGPVLQPGDLLA